MAEREPITMTAAAAAEPAEEATEGPLAALEERRPRSMEG